MKGHRVFPRRLFRWFLTKQILLATSCLAALDVVIVLYLQGRSDLSPEALETGRQLIVWNLMVTCAVVVVVSVVMARRLVIPLGRLIDKTQRIHRFPFDDEDATATEMDYDEPGEWYDLERALNELGRDLQHKTIRLSREKTELRTIMSAVNEAVLAINQERHPLFYNSQFAFIFQLENQDVSQMTIGEILRSPDILQAYDECLKKGVSARVHVRLEQTALGLRFFQVSVAPLQKKHNQEIYGAVAVFHDVTDMKKAEQIRIEFVGNVSHELRTPLTSIRGYLQTAVQDVRSQRTEQTLEFLEIAQRNVDRLMHLVDDLLDLSALQAGVELQRQSIVLRTLTAGVLNQVDTRAHRVQEVYEVETLMADEHRVEQVLRNLLQNAVRYVPQQGQVDISWRLGGNSGVVLSVKDNGPGVAREHHHRLFERFYRVDEARSRAVGGSGIGLALVKHIMTRHGGSVAVVSEKGQGAEFICEFPVLSKGPRVADK